MHKNLFFEIKTQTGFDQRKHLRIRGMVSATHENTVGFRNVKEFVEGDRKCFFGHQMLP